MGTIRAEANWAIHASRLRRDRSWPDSHVPLLPSDDELRIRCSAIARGEERLNLRESCTARTRVARRGVCAPNDEGLRISFAASSAELMIRDRLVGAVESDEVEAEVVGVETDKLDVVADKSMPSYGSPELTEGCSGSAPHASDNEPVQVVRSVPVIKALLTQSVKSRAHDSYCVPRLAWLNKSCTC